MPDDLACTGASTGNICTVRYRNNAITGRIGGCFAVSQRDITVKINTPENINTLQIIEAVEAQI